MAKQKVGVHGTDAENSPKPGTAEPQGAKKTCPITREQFNENAKPLKITMEYDGKTFVFVGSPRQFDSGSMGWNINEKAVVDIDSVPVSCQVGMNITIVKSKELPK